MEDYRSHRFYSSYGGTILKFEISINFTLVLSLSSFNFPIEICGNNCLPLSRTF